MSNLENKKIAIYDKVDDVSSSLISIYFKRFNVNTLVCSDERSLLNLVKNYDLDVVYVNPGNTYNSTLLNSIKQVNNNLPVVLVSAKALQGDKEIFLNQGYDYYISKPFELKNLLCSANEAFKSYDAFRHNSV